jgi:hypothetical protein
MLVFVTWVHHASIGKLSESAVWDGSHDLFVWMLAGAGAYFVGRLLMPERLSGFGRVLTATGVLWWVSTGLCHAAFYAAQESGLVHGGAFAIIALGAVMIAIGQALRPATAEPFGGERA